MAHLQSWAKAPSRHACKLQPWEQSPAPVRLTHWPLALLRTLPSQDGKLSQGSTLPVAGCHTVPHPVNPSHINAPQADREPPAGTCTQPRQPPEASV